MSTPRPVIGDFRPTSNAAVRSDAPASPPVEEQAPPIPADPDFRAPEEAIRKTVEELKALDEDLSKLTPAERYRKRVKDAEVSLEQATTIYDGVLTKGYYEEYVRLGKTGRAVFRTRTYEDTLRLQTALELTRPQLALTQDELITRYNLAASLYEWRGEVVKHDTDEDFNKALLLIRKMPAPVYSLLAAALVKFDQKVMVVFSEGAAENFS